MQGCVDLLHVHLRGQERPSAEYPAEIQTLGDHIRKHQLDLGLLQKQVAVQLPTTPRAHNWESGHISPGFWYFSAIRLFLGYLPIPDTGTLADELEVHRFVRGWSQKEAARDLGVHPEHAGEVGAGGVGARGRFAVAVREWLEERCPRPCLGDSPSFGRIFAAYEVRSAHAEALRATISPHPLIPTSDMTSIHTSFHRFDSFDAFDRRSCI